MRPPSSRFSPCFEPVHERTDRAEVHIEHLAPGVLGATITGYGDEAVASIITRCASAVIGRDKRYHAFHDWTGMTGYASRARVRLTEWGREHPNARVSILFDSKLVAMGVSVATIAFPRLASFSDRTAFEAARARAVAEAAAAS